MKEREVSPEAVGDVARFTHAWMLENGQWKLNRSIGYDHQESSTADF